MENINLDVHQVLTVVSNLRDRNPESAARTLDVLRLILNREGFLPSDVQEAVAPLAVRMQAIEATLQSINQRLGAIMATQAQFEAALGRIDTATSKGAQVATAIAERITALETEIRNAGLTTEQENALLSRVQGVAGSAEGLATALEEMGKTPENPVPVEPAEPVPAEPDNGEPTPVV